LRLFDTLRSRAPDLQLAGLSATPYRLDSGYLHKGEGALFEKIVFSYQIAEGIKDGYLSPLRSKATTTRIDISGVHVRGGEFIQNELERAANFAEVVESAVAEIVERGNNAQDYRRRWICFCVGIDHAYAVRDAIRRHGISCETVTAETPSDERRAVFDAFRSGSIRCLTGVNIFSVGFDIPQVDLIALLRQEVERGTRLAPDKHDAVVLDFAGNVRRHGPVDDVTMNTIGRLGSIPGLVSTITCPQCQEESPMRVRACVCCGHIFVSEIRVYEPRIRQAHHKAVADDVPILSTQTASAPPAWHPVHDSEYRLHQKRGDTNAPPTLRVEHLAGFSPYSEYVSFESAKAYARMLACNWWVAMGGRAPVPMSVAEAIVRRTELGRVLEIQVIRDGQWWRINRRRVLRPDGVLVEIDSKYRCSKVAAEAEAAA
jgi:DNA repair protein RadD